MIWIKERNILVLSAEPTTFDIDSKNIFIDEGCVGITITGVVENISIGKNCEKVSIDSSKSSGIYIGNNCKGIEVRGSNDCYVGDRCEQVSLNNCKGNYIGKLNKNITLTNCIDNVIEGCDDINCRGNFSKLVKCSKIDIDEASQNIKLNRSKDVIVGGGLSIKTDNISTGSFTRTENVEVKVNGMNIVDGVPFRKYKPTSTDKVNQIKCNVENDNYDYDADLEGHIFSIKPEPLLDMPNRNDNFVYARLNGKWAKVAPFRELDPKAPPPDSPKPDVYVEQ